MQNQNKYISIIVVLLSIIVYLSVVIIRLENYHYAVQVGFCDDVDKFRRDDCLNKIQTRTNPMWHLIYAL